MKMRKRQTTMLRVVLLLGALCAGAAAQEMEPLESSGLTGAKLPDSAYRVMPDSVPAEVDRTLDGLVAAGGGKKLRRGATEVVVWAGPDYRRSQAGRIVENLRKGWKESGWILEISEEKDGLALFSLLREDGQERRALIGFYGAEEEAFVLALTELHLAAAAD